MRECENSTPRVAVGVRLRNNPPVITLHTSQLADVPFALPLAVFGKAYGDFAERGRRQDRQEACYTAMHSLTDSPCDSIAVLDEFKA
jgi:hypothetical protein